MRNKKFKQANRAMPVSGKRMPIHLNNKQVMISKWRANLLERLVFLLTGVVWVKVDSRSGNHRPQVHHPFVGVPKYTKKNKRGFTPHGEY